MGSCCEKEPEALEALQRNHAKVLWTVLSINLTMFIVEGFCGLYAGSTAVLADSLDMLGDALVYGFSIFVLGRSAKWQGRASMLKGLIMLVFGLAVMGEAFNKFWHTTIPNAEVMNWVGIAALAMNSICFALLWNHRSDNINMQSTWVCSRNDLIANVGVLAAAGLTVVTHSKWPDLAVGLLIATVFLRSAILVIQAVKRSTETSCSVVVGKPQIREDKSCSGPRK